MGLFGKKDPCAICGGKVSGLFVSKIAGKHVCNACYGIVDLPAGSMNDMTIERFKQYMQFREENNALKEQFVKSETIDFGFLDTKLVFDHTNKLLALNKNLDGTIFEGKHIASFSITEDTMPLFEGSPAGLRRYVSTIPNRVLAMAPQIDEYMMKKRMREQMNKDNDDYNSSKYDINIPEPFSHFNLLIRFKHPYWTEFRADMDAPIFSNSNPRIEDYMNDYNNKVVTIENLAHALMELAFEGTPEQMIDSGAMGMTGMAYGNTMTYGNAMAYGNTMGMMSGVSMAAPQAAGNVSEDPAASIRKFKELLEQGLITEEEFNAKKRQILGI